MKFPWSTHPYIQTNSGWVYTAFIIDVFSRAIVGWKVSTRMNTDMVLDALERALHDRGMPKNVIHHSDRGVQYLSIRYGFVAQRFHNYMILKVLIIF